MFTNTTPVTSERVEKLVTLPRYLLTEALKRGYTCNLISLGFGKYQNLFLVEHNEKVLTVIQRNRYSDLSYTGRVMTKNKYLTYKLAKSLHIDTPETEVFKSVEQAKTLWKNNFKSSPVVLKPQSLGQGKSIYVDIQTEEDIVNAAENILTKTKDCAGVIQDYRKGEDIRIHAVGGKLFYACTRVPANVTGDGEHTLHELIGLKNGQRLPILGKSQQIVLTGDSEKLLKQQNVTLDSIPAKNQYVQINKISNISKGGDIVNVTDTLDGEFSNLVEKVAKILNIKTFAIDMMVPEIKDQISFADAWLIEINAPCMWVHLYYDQVKKVDIASAILDSYFYPEGFNPKDEKYIIQ